MVVWPSRPYEQIAKFDSAIQILVCGRKLRRRVCLGRDGDVVVTG